MRDDAEHIDPSGNLHMMEVCLALPAIGTPSHPGAMHSLGNRSFNTSTQSIYLLECGALLFLSAALQRLIGLPLAGA